MYSSTICGRSYQNYDPRAKLMQEMCHAVLRELNITSDPFLELALQLEKTALNDEYFIKRKLYYPSCGRRRTYAS